jgi:isoamylase
MDSLRAVDEFEQVEGNPWPLGATWVEAQRGFNFALFSRYATSVTLLLYTRDDPTNPVHLYEFDPILNKTGLIWHCQVPVQELRGATLYAYRIDGPKDPSSGHCFDAQKVLLDPFALSVYFPPEYSRSSASRPGPTDGLAPLGRLIKNSASFDWDVDTSPHHGHDLIVYELHVKGFTARSNSGVSPEKRGTFAGLIEMIPYLKDLGITVVELLPVHDKDLYVMINAHWEDLTFTIQEGRPEDWCRIVDTSLASPEDIAWTEEGYPVSGLQHVVKARSIVVFLR